MTTDILVEKYWTRKIIKRFCDASNDYIQKIRENKRGLICWKRQINSCPITLSCIYEFLAILYYFGVVRLPQKQDYWSSEINMPINSVTTELAMTRHYFQFLLQHFHVQANTNNDKDLEDVDSDDEGDEQEGLMEQGLERVQRDQEEEDGKDGDLYRDAEHK